MVVVHLSGCTPPFSLKFNPLQAGPGKAVDLNVGAPAGQLS